MTNNKLTQNEKEAIREAAEMIYAASKLDEIHNKQEFMHQLQGAIASTPMAQGYAKAARVVSNLR